MTETTQQDPNSMRQIKRCDGTTTRQIKASPQGAIYVAPAADYVRHLACDLGRSDLKIESLEFFRAQKYSGIKKSQIVIDHACAGCMSNGQLRTMLDAMEQLHG